ncbi:thiol:disulfide interchange protein DsbD [Andreprevotia lacus DSM 23236]|jgi:thiol:disulfide interchange protein DsbD|uniref:Thiol:disulfide interchange protein DsbD n=1 Tax=Andreprevotia lacus DSM 23236 TaxID=1121001 RepID=A0A1W1XKW3_9NEIS|nr:protein-disulfide reductase DsbD [Andreprevotia lacus]SMC24457.1 thiol:disulfide interchange protein DsbD [Andreprevotia lacus DSM 23236]
MTRVLFALLLAPLLLLCSQLARAEADLLPPEQAFRAELNRIDERTVNIQFRVADGYYLYRERMRFTLQPAGDLAPTFPAGVIKDDPSFGKVEVYKHDTAVTLHAANPLPDDFRIAVRYQGCAEAGVCYPPQTTQLSTANPGISGSKSAVDKLFGTKPAPAPAADARSSDAGYFSGSPITTLSLFFLAGLGLAFTACMYPLLPIVSSIVIGAGQAGRGRALLLTLTYSQGLALTYTAVGVAAALTGTLLSVWLQQPWVIGAFALFFVAMALSMFGVFSLQMPGSLQSRFSEWSNRLPGGRYLSVFVMGALSAAIVGPCIAPPLAAALAYIGQQGNALLGGGALYAMALGLGVPLVVIGVLGNSILPRLPRWTMRVVQNVFGVLLLGMAIWVARPLWQPWFAGQQAAVAFTPVASSQALDSHLGNVGKPVMLDFYADWCVSCIEFERETLSDPRVQAALKDFVVLRADVTRNSADDASLLRRFGLYGPPAMLFFTAGAQGPQQRVIGFQNADAFLKTLESLRTR